MSKLGTANEASTGIGLYLCRKIMTKAEEILQQLEEGWAKEPRLQLVF
jgi:hypothetical protein